MILSRLKRETADIHQRVEGGINIGHRLSGPDEYRQLLQLFWGLYASLETELTPRVESQPWPLDWDRRIKLPLLEKDLRIIGLTGSQFADLQRCDKLPMLTTPSQVLGVLYVLEGSTLGGLQISKMIQQKLGLGADDGAAFFNGYGSATGSMWKLFGAVLTNAATNVTEEDEMIAAAKETFGIFEHWLCPPHA